MSLDPFTAAINLGQAAIERIWPDANRRAEEIRKLEELRQSGDLALLQANVQLLLAQLDVNKVEAAHKSLFVAGWRPGVGWLCILILAFNYIGVYMFEYLAVIGSVDNPPPQRMNMTDLWPVLLGMLGIGGMRSFDKKNRTQTDRI